MVYVGAQWCPWSRKFTPELINFYNEVITENPEYEVVYIPGERSNSELMQYSKEMNFPWPILRFDAKDRIAVLKTIITRSTIPALGLADIYGVNILDMSEYSHGAVLNKVYANIQEKE